MPRSFLIRKILAISDSEDEDHADAAADVPRKGEVRKECAYVVSHFVSKK